MNHYITFAFLFATVGARGISTAVHGTPDYVRNASLVDEVTVLVKPSDPKLATDDFRRSEELNRYLGRDYLAALAGLIVVLLLCRLVLHATQHIRTLACLANDTQRYFALPNADWINFKRHLLYAPLFKARHSRELRLSAAVNMGTLPTRFQSVLLTAILATNVTLCVYGIPWHASESDVLSMLRNRTGSIAVANLIPIMILSSPQNPLIKSLNIPFDVMNIIHRNVARLAIFEAVAHVICHVIKTVKSSGWSAVGKSVTNDNMIMAGMIAVLALLVILIQSSSALRHAFYETFVHLHVVLVILVLVFLWFHLDGFSPRSYLLATVIVWCTMRFLRLVTFIKCNLGREGTKATVEVLPGEAVRLSISTARQVHARPGSYIYLYIPSVGLWTSHPFSIAWSDSEVPLSRTTSGSIYDEKIPAKDSEVDPRSRQILSAVIRQRTGFTDLLYQKAKKAGAYDGTQLTLNAFVEAGYGIYQSVLSSCGTVMLFAAGIGVTHQIPYVRHLVEGYAAGTVAVRKVVLVWVTQSPEHLEWIRPWMTQILAMEKRREVLQIKLFITQPKHGREVTSPSATVQMQVS